MAIQYSTFFIKGWNLCDSEIIGFEELKPLNVKNKTFMTIFHAILRYNVTLYNWISQYLVMAAIS